MALAVVGVPPKPAGGGKYGDGTTDDGVVGAGAGVEG